MTRRVANPSALIAVLAVAATCAVAVLVACGVVRVNDPLSAFVVGTSVLMFLGAFRTELRLWLWADWRADGPSPSGPSPSSTTPPGGSPPSPGSPPSSSPSGIPTGPQRPAPLVAHASPPDPQP